MTQKIFIIGAGRSASSLIKYLINVSAKNNFELTIGDKDVSLVKDKIDGHKCASAIRFDVLNDDQRIFKRMIFSDRIFAQNMYLRSL